MYGNLSESVLDWPSLTVQFLPKGSVTPAVPVESPPSVIELDLVLGTYTSDETQNYLMLGSAKFSEKSKVKSTITIDRKLKHEGEVNRARVKPQNNSIIATASNTGAVYLYDTSKESDTYFAELKEHTENGYGLSWNTAKDGYLLTSSDDRKTVLWDTLSESYSTPLSVFEDAQDIANDVAWQNRSNSNLFGLVSEDKNFYFYDIRASSKAPSLKKEIHGTPINTLAFSIASEYIFATGGSDNAVVLSDLRNLDIRLHTLLGHSKMVTTLQWSPHDDRVLASSGPDRRVILWDISKVGEEQSQEDQEDGAPELLFMHGGHTNGVSDFSFHEKYPWTIASVSEDNICQIWQPKPAVVGRAKPHVKGSDLE